MMLHIAFKDAIGSFSPRSLVTSPAPLPTRPSPVSKTRQVQESLKTIVSTGGKTSKGADVIENKGTNLGGARKESNTEGQRITIFSNALKNATENALPSQRPRPLVPSPPSPATTSPVRVGVSTTPPLVHVVPPATPLTTRTAASTKPNVLKLPA